MEVIICISMVNVMTEIRFYHLQRQSQHQVLPVLLSKALAKGHRIVVKLRDKLSVEQMNEHLWSYHTNSFLPHGSEKDGNSEHQPIWLTEKDENPNQADVLILGDGVESEIMSDFELCCEMLNGQDDEQIAASRVRWKQYKDHDFEVTYWQQTDQGGWEQKA